MAKTITIPDAGRNPLRIQLNNMEYTFYVGQQYTVDDAVAALIDNIYGKFPTGSKEPGDYVVRPVEKTDTMTGKVGIDDDGQLWSEAETQSAEEVPYDASATSHTSGSVAAALKGKADLDATTGKVISTQLPPSGTPTDADSVSYNSSTTYTAGTVGKALKDTAASVATHSSQIEELTDNFADEYNPVLPSYSAYDSTTTYAVGAKVIYSGSAYVCKTAITTAEAFDSTKWTVIPIYAIGDLVTHDNGMYKCTTAVTTVETWTAAHWTVYQVSGLNKDLACDGLLVNEKFNLLPSHMISFNNSLFEKGSITSGSNSDYQKAYRARSISINKYPFDIIIRAVNSYKFYLALYSEGTYQEDVAWITNQDYLISANQEFRMVVTLNNGTTEQTVEEILNNIRVVFPSYSNQLINENLYSITQKSEDWEVGTITVTTGINGNYLYRIRTKETLSSDGLKAIKSINSYKFAVFAYETDGTYVGAYNGIDGFSTSGSFYMRYFDVDTALGNNNYNFRIVLARPSDASMSADECSNILFYKTNISKTNESIDELTYSVYSSIGKSILTESDFEHGNITNGENSTYQAQSRIRNINRMKFPFDIAISCLESRTIYYFYYNEDGSLKEQSSSWLINTRFVIPANTIFRLLVCFNNEDSTSRSIHDIRKGLSICALPCDISFRHKDALKNIWSAKYTFSGNSSNVGEKLFTIAHLSDIHQDTVRFDNFNRFVDENNSAITTSICTGDFVFNPTDDEFASILPSPTSMSLIRVIGNHETNQNGYTKTVSEACEKLGIESGYYSVDYSDYGIKIIVLNQYDNNTIPGVDYIYSQSQIDWLITELDAAITNNYSVMIAMHRPESFPASNENGFYQRYFLWDESGKGSICSGYPIEDLISAFKSGGTISSTYTFTSGDFTSTITVNHTFASAGVFIAYMVGHYHGDYIGYSTAHSNQLYLLVTCGAYGISKTAGTYTHRCDLSRIENTQSEDAFNVYAVDLTNKKIKVVRVGADENDQFQKRQTAIFAF